MHRAFVDKIFEEKTANSSVSLDLTNALNIISKTVFGDINRFIFELLQNADDSAEAETPLNVTFRLMDNYLIFSHNGKHFTKEDVRGISSVGNRASEKDKDSEKTGYKGIGFKSIFGSSEYAYIASGAFTFRFDRNYEGFSNPDEYPWQVIPIWTDNPPGEVEDSLEPDKVTTVIGVKDRSLIQKEIIEVFNDCQIILFLRNVSTITFFDHAQQIFTVSKVRERDMVSLYKNGNQESSWILRTMDLDVSEDLSEQLSKLSETECPQKLKQANTTKLTFAAKVVQGKLTAVPQSVIYSYLPTKAQKGFPFLINGDFLTNAERTELMPNIWNEFLFKEIARRQLEWFRDLSNTEHRYYILHLFKEKYPFSGSAMEKAFNDSLDEAVVNISFLPIQNDTARTSTIVQSIEDADLLSDFFNPATILANLGIAESYEIMDLKLEKQAVLSGLVAKRFSFKEAFVIMASGRAADINSGIQFMVYFYNNTARGENNSWLTELNKAAFIMDETGVYRNAAEIFFPGAQRTGTGLFGSINYVHSAILNHFKDCMSGFIEWLGKLGVKEPDNVELFRKAVIPLINRDAINKDNFLEVTEFIFRTHQSKLLTESDYESLKKLSLSSTNGFHKPSHTYLSDEYNPDQKLSGVLLHANFLSNDYVRDEEKRVEWKTFFKRIGVRDKVSIDVLEGMRERTAFAREHPESEAYFNWLDDKKAYATVYYPWRLSGQHNISNFTKVEFRSNLADQKFAKQFWTGMMDSWGDFKQKCNSTKYYHRGGSEPIPSYLEYYVANFPSVPANDGHCHCSTSLFSPALKHITGEYLPTADFPASITRDQVAFFGFKTILSLTECLTILDRISSDELSADRKKQVFAIYDYMVGNGLTGSNEILEWHRNARLLTINNTFQPIQKLYIFNIYGNVSPGNPERFLKLKDGRSSDEINALADLLMVPRISLDMLEFVKKGEVVDLDLKASISHKLVYLAVIHAHNTGENFKNMVHRLQNMVKERTFYKADQLKLVYKSDEGEMIINNDIDVWSTQLSVYYTGNWKQPLSLYSLSSKLCEVLLLKNMEREFALILQLSDIEIKEWLIKNSYNVEQINEVGLFATEYKEVEGQKKADADSLQEGLKVEFFEEKIKVKDIDFSNIVPIKKESADYISSLPTEYKPIENAAVRTDIGRWSEEYIFEYFKKNPTVFTSIKWMNEEGESYLPYDFQIVENGVDKLIEVKGTPSLNKSLIYLSKKEWQIMIKNGKDYSLFRVYGAGSETNHIHRIDDIQSLINEGAIDFKVELYI